MEIQYIVVGYLQTNCYFLISGREVGIVDPGGDPEEILKQVKNIGLRVKYIINTHHHPDHTFATNIIKRKTEAKVLIHQDEQPFIDFEVDWFLREGDEINLGKDVLKVLHTPGHTRGSICLLGEDFILTGDSLFKEGCGRIDLPGGSQKEMDDSLARLSQLIKPGMMVYPGHGDVFQYGFLEDCEGSDKSKLEKNKKKFQKSQKGRKKH